MRIKSNFRDYYDGVQSFGLGDTQYIRYAKLISGRNEHNWEEWSRKFNNNIYYGDVYIHFCSKIYTGFQFYGSKIPETKFMYTEEKLVEFADKYGIHFERKNYPWQRNSPLVKIENNGRIFEDRCLEHKCPIIIYHGTSRIQIDKHSYRYDGNTTLNGCLKNYNFETVYDPYSCYQEISMWLNNLASPEKPIPKIDDVTMAEAKGFDKWSFRKEPSKKK